MGGGKGRGEKGREGKGWKGTGGKGMDDKGKGWRLQRVEGDVEGRDTRGKSVAGWLAYSSRGAFEGKQVELLLQMG